MPRVETTVINDLIRECGNPESIHVDWKIPIERAGWECSVTIGLYYHPTVNPKLYIAVHAQGHLTGTGADELSGYASGYAFYTAIKGHAPPHRLTRKWIESVLRREIETARAAALSFTGEDLHMDILPFCEEAARGMRDYFESSLR